MKPRKLKKAIVLRKISTRFLFRFQIISTFHDATRPQIQQSPREGGNTVNVSREEVRGDRSIYSRRFFSAFRSGRCNTELLGFLLHGLVAEVDIKAVRNESANSDSPASPVFPAAILQPRWCSSHFARTLRI